jgi:hypothetical protein
MYRTNDDLEVYYEPIIKTQQHDESMLLLCENEVDDSIILKVLKRFEHLLRDD